jgi:hypothetical protein
VRAFNDRRKVEIDDYDPPLRGHGLPTIKEYLDAVVVIEIVEYALDDVAVSFGRDRLEEISCHHFAPSPEASVTEASCPFQDVGLLE